MNANYNRHDKMPDNQNLYNNLLEINLKTKDDFFK